MSSSFKTKFLSIAYIAFSISHVFSQVILDADGPENNNTYELITSVLAPGYDPVEEPDCGHTEFGRHIDEIDDVDLGINVFRFFIHATPDNDRCINFDRQRNEIKTYDQSPDNLLGIEDETVQYKWKFKLDAGFQVSPNFTHLHQLKSVGGLLAGMPMYTITARKGTPNQLELRYAETDTQITLQQTDLAPFKGSWLEVTETINYGTSGTYSIEIKKVNDGTILFNYSNNSIINWRTDADFVRPKWGIYRSLNNVADLRDEEVLFANFSIEELNTLSVNENEFGNQVSIFPNPTKDILFIKNSSNANLINIYSMDGRKIMENPLQKSNSEILIDVSSFSTGAYSINISNQSGINQSKIILISN